VPNPARSPESSVVLASWLGRSAQDIVLSAGGLAGLAAIGEPLVTLATTADAPWASLLWCPMAIPRYCRYAWIPQWISFGYALGSRALPLVGRARYPSRRAGRADLEHHSDEGRTSDRSVHSSSMEVCFGRASIGHARMMWEWRRSRIHRAHTIYLPAGPGFGRCTTECRCNRVTLAPAGRRAALQRLTSANRPRPASPGPPTPGGPISGRIRG
jgi:hypothetical protein